MCEIISSPKALADKEGLGAKFRKLFEALCKAGVTQFELLVVVIAVGSASFARQQAPSLKSSVFCGTRGSSSFRVDELHCVGAETGLRLKNKRDATALKDITTRVWGRTSGAGVESSRATPTVRTPNKTVCPRQRQSHRHPGADV